MKFSTTCLLTIFAGLLWAPTMLTTTSLSAEVANAGPPKIFQRGAYIGPYTLEVNGFKCAVLCLDFQNDSPIRTSYSAYETQLSNNNFSNAYKPSSGTPYKEEAYLMSLILLPNSDRIDIQHAAWAITDPDFKADQAANTYISMAQKNYGTMTELGNFNIISGTDRGAGRAQEFMIDPGANAPEPASILLMGGGLIMACLVQRKMVKKT